MQKGLKITADLRRNRGKSDHSDLWVLPGVIYHFAVKVPCSQFLGYFWGPIFGVFEWLPVENLPFVEEPRDYAYRIHGIPEPSAVALLAAGGILALGRRR